MSTIKIEKIQHKGSEKIRIEFGYDKERIERVKQIPGAQWSQSQKAWHIPDTNEDVEKFNQLFPDSPIVQPTPEIPPKAEPQEPQKARNEIVVEVSAKNIWLKMPKNTADIAFVKTIKFSRWNPKSYRWEMQNYADNLDRIKQYFGKRITQIVTIDEPKRKTNLAETTKISLYDKELPPTTKNQIRQFEQWMIHKRYSESTVKNYISALTTFLWFVLPKIPESITDEDFVRFVNEYLIPNNLGNTTQNQTVSGAKLFFKQIVKTQFDPEVLERPQREHLLPKVLSKQEVAVIITGTANLKHRTMLSLIYTCGLRRSDVLGLKIEHVDSKRGLLSVM